MRWRLACLFAVLGLTVGALAAQAQARRVALVIGNGAYEQLAPLANPASDAAALGERLNQLGFETHVYTDLTMRGMVDALKAFRSTARGAEFALVYYAGHGRQATIEDRVARNYLFPVDARPDEAIDLAREAMTIDEMFSIYLEAAGVGRSLVLVDAGRTLDLWEQTASLEDGPGAEHGFAAALPHTKDWFDYEIWYASQANTAADDGFPGASSPFTAALLTALGEPGLDTDDLFRRVAMLMRESSGPRQRPTPYGRLSTPIVIHEASPDTGSPVDDSAPDLAATNAGILDDPAFAGFPDMFEPAAQGPTDEQLDALLAWSNLQFEAGQYEGAVKALEQVLQYDPDNLEVWLALGDALFAQGDYQRATEVFRNRVLRGLDPQVLIDIGEALLESAHRQQAAMIFLMALALAEAHGDAEASAEAQSRVDSMATAVASETAEDQAGERLAAAWAAIDAGRFTDAEIAHAGILSDWPELAGSPELTLLAAAIADRLGQTGEAEDGSEIVAESEREGDFGVQAARPLAAPSETRESEQPDARSEQLALARADQIPIAALQWAMKALGHYTGPIDDSFGPATRTAAQAFQDRVGAEQTGDLTSEQRVLLVTMAAEAGQPESQNTLGIMYATGVGVPADVDQAKLWWERAAAQGFTKADDNLARLEE